MGGRLGSGPVCLTDLAECTGHHGTIALASFLQAQLRPPVGSPVYRAIVVCIFK